MLVVTGSITEHQAIWALAFRAMTTGFSTVHLHETSETLGAISLIFPGGALLKSITAPTDVTGFGAVGSHPPPVGLALSPICPFLTSVVFVNTITAL